MSHRSFVGFPRDPQTRYVNLLISFYKMELWERRHQSTSLSWSPDLTLKRISIDVVSRRTSSLFTRLVDPLFHSLSRILSTFFFYSLKKRHLINARRTEVEKGGPRSFVGSWKIRPQREKPLPWPEPVRLAIVLCGSAVLSFRGAELTMS